MSKLSDPEAIYDDPSAFRLTAPDPKTIKKTEKRIVPPLWLLTLWRFDGTKEYSTIRGTHAEASVQRDARMARGSYEKSWLSWNSLNQPTR